MRATGVCVPARVGAGRGMRHGTTTARGALIVVCAMFGVTVGATGAVARGCGERSGGDAGHIGTGTPARDLEAVRIAVGERTLTYLGFSYGTIIGMTYAQMFPTAVRAMVLDGPPNYWQSTLDYAHS